MKLTLFSLLIFFSTVVKSQLTTSYNFSSIDMTNSNSFTGPVFISNDKSCLQLYNGIQVFSATSKGGALFNPICETNFRDLTPSLVIAPNPSPGITKIYLTNNGILSNDKVTLIINDATGKVIQEHVCKGSQLREGFILNTNRIAKGMYFVKVFTNFTTSTISLNSQSSTTLKLINIHN